MRREQRLLQLAWILLLVGSKAAAGPSRLQQKTAFVAPAIQSKNAMHKSEEVPCCSHCSVRQTASDSVPAAKRVVFIRHGCTHMNEYLSTRPFGCVGFTDVFPEERLHKYRDSPLSPRGVSQALALSNRLGDLAKGRVHETMTQEYMNILNELDLIVVSPLTRALQTLELGLMPHITSSKQEETDHRPQVPIVALPQAAERLYLISDVGKPKTELHDKYGHIIDFEFDEEHWWFMHNDDDYVEWRPSGKRQTYACPGEPDDDFHSRMASLYTWIEDRPESTIAVVCHWGVIDWFLNEEFGNCEMRIVPFHEIRPKTMPKRPSRELKSERVL